MIAEVHFYEAEYFGDEQDGVYVEWAEGPDGWYASGVVDCNSAHFCDALFTDLGPYPTENDARCVAVAAALEWCHTNDVCPD